MRVSIIFSISILLFLSACSSMSPIQVNQTLPTLTKSHYLSRAEADELIIEKTCKYLARDREYVAPIGFMPKDDLRNGAKGIDEWVEIDGGNSYVLKNFKWVTVDHNGTTQLTLEFDTLKCK